MSENSLKTMLYGFNGNMCLMPCQYSSLNVSRCLNWLKLQNRIVQTYIPNPFSSAQMEAIFIYYGKL